MGCFGRPDASAAAAAAAQLTRPICPSLPPSLPSLSLSQVDGEHPRLVRVAATVVGPPHPRLLCEPRGCARSSFVLNRFSLEAALCLVLLDGVGLGNNHFAAAPPALRAGIARVPAALLTALLPAPPAPRRRERRGARQPGRPLRAHGPLGGGPRRGRGAGGRAAALPRPPRPAGAGAWGRGVGLHQGDACICICRPPCASARITCMHPTRRGASGRPTPASGGPATQ